ncbi:hypothetical protein MNBD_GAMMA06-314 [hydrothermal vent metagenome]|uniref:CheW-like domain-containing protein n=1 Tax=hydrothermal vent metagenome TaxID=652676 RepID=A0A3B0WJQ9_9ZZZZ
MTSITTTQQISIAKQLRLCILSFNGTEILIAKNEVSLVNAGYVFEKNSPADTHLGYISDAEKKINLYGFSSTLELIKFYPVEKSQCIITRHARGEIAILCQDIKEITLKSIHTQPVPECMRSTNMPLTHLCLYQNAHNEQKMGMISNADTLFNYILNYTDKVKKS